MSFGQSSGPPASARQVQYLLALVQRAGHTGFRDARGPLGLTQRQAGGRFTSAEASALIDRLTSSEEAAESAPGEGAVAPAPLDPARAEMLRGVPADALAGELVRRGWTVSPRRDREPDDAVPRVGPARAQTP